VVDTTAELNRLLDSGHAQPPMPSIRSRSVRLTSPGSPGSSSTSDSTGPAQQTSRPRLTDHLRHVSFSPSRPRSAQGFNPTSPIARSGHRVAAEMTDKSMNVPTPRPSKRSIIQASLPAEVRIHPPTPSTAGSKFTRMAKGITKDIEATQQQILSNRLASSSSRPASAPPVERNPFHDEHDTVSTRPRMPASRKSSLRDTTKSRIYLPDVTGLTNAVESPLRPGANYYPYKAERPRDSEGKYLLRRTWTFAKTLFSSIASDSKRPSIPTARTRRRELDLSTTRT
jgi:HAMP domain-containing protein